MRFTIETEQEEDGRWIAEVLELPGVMKYGGSRAEATAQAEAPCAPCARRKNRGR